MEHVPYRAARPSRCLGDVPVLVDTPTPTSQVEAEDQVAGDLEQDALGALADVLTIDETCCPASRWRLARRWAHGLAPILARLNEAGRGRSPGGRSCSAATDVWTTTPEEMRSYVANVALWTKVIRDASPQVGAARAVVPRARGGESPRYATR
jgi:hypothetical protein